MVGGLFAVVGYLLLLFSGLQEISPISAAFTEDSVKMWFKLGGVSHILIGIFISLVAIIRTLSLVPHRLSEQLD